MYKVTDELGVQNWLEINSLPPTDDFDVNDAQISLEQAAETVL